MLAYVRSMIVTESYKRPMVGHTLYIIVTKKRVKRVVLRQLASDARDSWSKEISNSQSQVYIFVNCCILTCLYWLIPPDKSIQDIFVKTTYISNTLERLIITLMKFQSVESYTN